MEPDEPDESCHVVGACHISTLVTFFPPVMLVSEIVLTMFCAFTAFRPTIANMPIIAARIGMIKTNCFLINCW